MPKPVAADKPQHGGAAKLIAFPEGRSALAVAVDYGFGKSRLITISIILLLIAMIAAAWWVFSSRATFRYTTMPVTRGVVIHMVTGSGAVNPELAIIVGTYVSGVIQEALLRLQHSGEKRAALRQDRPAAFSDYC